MKPSARTHGRRRPEKARKGGPSFGRSRPSRRAMRDAGQDCRLQALADFARAARGLKWTKPLFLLLIDELYVGDEFDEIIGPPERVPVALYPGAIAFAVALRNSWRPDALAGVADALGLEPDEQWEEPEDRRLTAAGRLTDAG